MSGVCSQLYDISLSDVTYFKCGLLHWHNHEKVGFSDSACERQVCLSHTVIREPKLSRDVTYQLIE